MPRATFASILTVLLLFVLQQMTSSAGDSDVASDQKTDAANKVPVVDFATEIQPVLKRNCMACHHSKQDEGGLSMESEKEMLAGGDSGPGIVAGDVTGSLIWARASGEEDPIMPPEDNTVGAKPLSPAELDKLRQWILGGAVFPESTSGENIAWQPVPESIRSIYTTSYSPDGHWAALATANRVAVFDTATGKQVDSLVDPSLPQAGVADLDLIQSVRFGPLGQTIATGGFRTLRLWQRAEHPTVEMRSLASAADHVTLSPDGTRIGMVNLLGEIEIWDKASDAKQHTITTHSLPVTSLAWVSTDLLASCDAGGKLCVHQATDGQLARCIDHDSALRNLMVSGDSQTIAAINAADLAVVFSANDLSVVRTLDAIPGARSLCFTAPQRTLLAVAHGNSVTVVQPADGAQKFKFDGDASSLSLASSPDGAFLVVGGGDGKTRMWNLADGKPRGTSQSNLASTQRLAILAKDASRFRDSVVRMEKATETLTAELKKEDESLAKVTEAHKTATDELAAETKKLTDVQTQVATTEKSIAEATATLTQAETESKTVQQQLTDTEAVITKVTAEQTELVKKSDVAKAALEQAKAELAAAKEKADQAQATADLAAKQAAESQAQLDASKKMADEKRAKLAMLEKSKTDATKMMEQAKAELEKQKASVTKLAEEKTKKEETVAKRLQALETARQSRQRAADAIPAQQTLISMVKEQLQETERTEKTFREQSSFAAPIHAVAVSPDASTVVSVASDGWIRTYRASDGSPIDEFPPGNAARPASTSDCVFVNSADLWINGWNRSVNVTRRWKLTDTIGTVDGDLISDRVTAIDFDPTGELIAVGSGAPSRAGQVLIVSQRTGQVLRRMDQLHSDTVLTLRFSPDGKTLASGAADKSIRLVDVRSGELIRSLDGHTHHVLGVDWSDNGLTLVSCSADKSVKVWDAQTGQQKRTINGFGDEITAIEFLPNVSQVATACADGQVRIHNTDNGGQVRAMSAGGDFLFSVSLSPDGGRIISGGQSGVVKQWNVADGKHLGDFSADDPSAAGR
ncbi:WD40 repeat domain-containing protein [Stieleria varia]|uniref:Chromosome partition protein Smc n=1 Tax=Stieleria varia TaxID=2528005 RepID=A0A5C6A8I8_9BACT|nr:c-type cytochrome domain-containing protein [Stieleria varia]TWT94603.1 Chromosome partition protein Smc [Stieleria varia]